MYVGVADSSQGEHLVLVVSASLCTEGPATATFLVSLARTLLPMSSSAELDLQSRLKWRPLFQLVQLQQPTSAGDHCVVNSSVECTVTLKYQGPKVGGAGGWVGVLG